MTSQKQEMHDNIGATRSRKRRWLSGSSAAAAAILLVSAPQPAVAQSQLLAPDFNPRDVRISARADLIAINQAQATGPRIDPNKSFQANLVTATEFVSLSSNATSDVVTIASAENIITWNPLDTANSDDLINILPDGTSLTFVGPAAGYTVLNRILPTGTTASGDPRGIAFGGNVSSRLGAVDGAIGGNIWFYSPGGIVVGASSTFDVGGLLLTTNNIDTIGATMSFNGAADSTSSIIIENGATINALNDRSSYVAMVAPRVVQGGSVSVDGSVAYVAAEQADLTINNGLFDISIGVGTSDANGIVHTGTTTGPASTPTFDGAGAVTDADAQAIYMVAVPKNTALTMLVGGTAGYEQAASASVVNGNVILSAGGNVTVGGPSTAPTNSIEKNLTSTAATNIQIGGAGGATFDSTLELFSSDDITISALSDADSVVISNVVGSQDLNLTAGNQINLNTSGGGQILVNGDVNLTAGTGATGGNINLNIDRNGFGTPIGTGLRVSGNLTADSSASGADDFFNIRNNGNTGIGQDAVGGNIAINITDEGVLDVGGNATFLTSAQGGKGELQNGSGQAGNIVFDMDSGTAQFGGNVDFDTTVRNASDGKIAGNGPGLLGSSSTAGNIDLNLSGGEMTAAALGLTTFAIGTSGSDNATAQNNTATAGDINLIISAGAHNFDSLDFSAFATGGSSFDAAGNSFVGDVTRSSVNLDISNSGTNVSVTDTISVDTSTNGNILNDPALDAVTINILNTGGESGLAVANAIDINTSASNGGPDGVMTAGSVSIVADNGDIDFNNLALDTRTELFSVSESSAVATAGSINLIARNGAAISGNSVDIYAYSNTESANGVNAVGGDVLLHANDGSIVLAGDLNVNTSARGGVKDAADQETTTARGGSVRVLLEGTSPISSRISASNIDFNADGSIVTGVEITPLFAGGGGSGFGGEVIFDILGGTLIADDIVVSASGSGGEGGAESVLAPAGLPIPGIAAMAAPMDLTVVNAPMAAGASPGDGGDGQGGDVTFNLDGGNATVTNLSISADGFGGNGANGEFLSGTDGGNGGRGIGGNATFNAISGDLTVTNTLTVSAEANNPAFAPYATNARGGSGYGSSGGNGGDGIGGTATFNMNGSATINADDVQISTSANGGRGGATAEQFDGVGTFIPGGPSGSGGNATGGDARLVDTSGTLTFGSLTVQSVGTGGNGGDNRNINAGSGFADSQGGNGGTATGGNAIIDLNQDDATSRNMSVSASALGGQGAYGLSGGNGGAAYGGVAAININDAAVDLDDPTILANATGGDGGQGRINPAGNNVGDSGNGGDATAGTARLEVTGSGGNIDLGFIILEANATGGSGTDGFYQFGVGFDGGDGGSGGEANGGTVELIARTGGTINLTSGDFTMSSTGTGGVGGYGGNSYNSVAGDGGDGGDGTGGTGRLLAQGGTISGNNLNITTAGIGGDTGDGGYYGVSGTDGTQGNGGIGSGGTGIVEIQEGSPGIVAFGDAAIDSSGTGGDGLLGRVGAGGRIEISDSSTDPAGLISFDSLTATAFDTAIGTGTGSSSALLGGFFVTGDSGAMAIVGDLVVDVAGNIEYNLDGDAQMTVGGNATLNSGQDILINHGNNATLVDSLDVVGTFDATAQANFISTDGSRINAGGTASVRAEQNATVADIAGVGLVDISALQNVAVNNAAVTGAPAITTIGLLSYVTDPQLTINAGYDPAGTPFPTFDPSYNATVTGDVTSTGLIAIGAGGTAYFRSGSNVVSDNGLAVRTGDDIVIEAGASLTAANNPSTTPNAAQTFTNPGNLILQAGDFTGLFGTPIGTLGSIPLTPIASIVAAGDLDANGFAVVMTANAVDGLGGTITANSISVDINNAPANNVTQSDDNGLLSAQCLEGNVCLGTLNADNLVYIGQASNNDVIQAIVESGTVSANDILVTTRRDIVMGTTGIATTLDASNQLALESIEGDIDLAEVSASSNAITVNAAGSLLGTANLNSANDIGITVGADINAASITTDGQLTTVALVGGVPESVYTVPGSIAVGALTQNGDFDIEIVAGGDISFDRINLPANRSIALTATNGDAFLGSNSSATSITISGENVGFSSLQSTGAVTLNATTGDLTGSGPGDLSAGGSIALGAADAINIGNAFTAGLGQSINLFANDITADNLETNSGDILVSAAQNISLGSAATGTGTPTAASIGLLAGGNIASTGALNAGEDVAIRALGGVALATVLAGDDFTVLADGTITLDSATTTGTGIDLFALSFDTANAGQPESIGFGSEPLTGSNIQLDSGGDITAIGTLNANDNINITATGTPTIANAISGGNTNISGASVALNNGTIGGNLTLTALAGDIDGNGTVVVGGGIALDATGNVGFGDLDAQGGSFTVDAGGNIEFASAASSGDMDLNAGGGISGGDINSGGDVMLNGTTIDLNTASGADIDIISNGAISFATLDASGGVDIESRLGVGGAITGGDINAGGPVTIESNRNIFLDTVNGGANVRIRINNNSNLTAGSINSGSNVNVRMQGAFVADEVNAAKTGQGQVSISADNDINLADVSGNDIFLTADNGLVNVTNNVDVTNIITASGEAVSLVSQQAMAVKATATNGDIGLSSLADLTLLGAEATGSVNIASGGSAILNEIVPDPDSGQVDPSAPKFAISSGGDVTVSAAGDVLIDSEVNAANDLQITADGLIDIQAATIGSTIQTASADMNIGSTGSLGLDAMTSDIQIYSNGSTQMRLGDGTELTGTFSLTNDEFSRIQSGGDLTIYAVETGLSGYDLTIQDLSASAFFGGNFDVNGSFNILADQSIRVAGRLSVEGDFDTNLNLEAGNDLFVNAATGLIEIGNDGLLSGNLSLSASNIYAMTDQAFDDIQGMDTAETDIRLAQNDGNVRDNGFIVARTIEVTLLASQFYVQNTGNGTDFDARRGFVAGAGGLSINSGPSGITPIVINGTVNDATGIAALSATTITGSGYNQQSTINGCVIANPASCGPTPPPTPTPDVPEIDDPIQDVIEEEVTPEEYAADPLASNLIEIKENEDMADDPLIDEPVTGAGNDDLWVNGYDCDLNSGGECQTDDDEDEAEVEPAE